MPTSSHHHKRSVHLLPRVSQSISDPINRKLVTIADDLMMKTFDLPTPKNDELVELQLIEQSAENFTIATNNVDKIAIGGAEKMVVVHNFTQELSESGKFLAKIEGDPFIGLVFNSAVKKIEFFGANQLLAISEDSTAKVVDLQTGKMMDFICGKHNGSIKSAAIDPLDEFLATIGCDGKLHIMSLKSNTLLKQNPLFDDSKTFKPDALTLKWSPDGSKLYVTGDKQLIALDRKGGSSSGVTSCSHNEVISQVEAPSTDVLITYGLDKELSVWRVTPTDFIKTHSYTAAKDITQIQYCRRNQMIGFMDVECSIGVIKLDLN